MMRDHVLLPLMAGLFLGILAPFGSGSLGFIGRFVFWIGLTFAGGTGALIARVGLLRLQSDAPDPMLVLAMSAGATLAVCPFVLAMFGTLSLPSVLVSLFYIWVISLSISTVGLIAERAKNPAAGPLNEIAAPDLLERLPPKFRDKTLYALTSEDHYVRVITEIGDHLVLMRLTDAEKEVSPLAGVKTHRSWWVAEKGVANIQRKQGKMLITLNNGVDVPVSRAGAQRVKDAGWLS